MLVSLLFYGIQLERKNKIFREVEWSCGEVWEVVRFNASLGPMVTRPFCNYYFSLILLKWTPLL